MPRYQIIDGERVLDGTKRPASKSSRKAKGKTKSNVPSKGATESNETSQ